MRVTGMGGGLWRRWISKCENQDLLSLHPYRSNLRVNAAITTQTDGGFTRFSFCSQLSSTGFLPHLERFRCLFADFLTSGVYSIKVNFSHFFPPSYILHLLSPGQPVSSPSFSNTSSRASSRAAQLPATTRTCLFNSERKQIFFFTPFFIYICVHGYFKRVKFMRLAVPACL